MRALIVVVLLTGCAMTDAERADIADGLQSAGDSTRQAADANRRVADDMQAEQRLRNLERSRRGY